jgi:WD40 repeat protein
MPKILLSILFIFLNINLFSKDLAPSYVYTASGGVTDIVYNKNKIYVSTQAGTVDIFDITTHDMIDSIKVPKITDFMGDEIDAKIYNADTINNKIVFTVQAKSGYREIFVKDDKELKKIISTDDKLYVTKTKFIDENKILFATLGNKLYLYDLKEKKTIWDMDIIAPDAEFNSTFADFALNEDRSICVVADESGDLKVVDIKNKKITKILAGKNLDKVFKVDFKNNKIITAGQDGRCVVYDLLSNKDYALRKKHWFLIYAAGLSPKAELGAYSSDEQNNVTVFNTNTKSQLYLLTNNLMTLNTILFISENELFVATDSNKFNYYKLP